MMFKKIIFFSLVSLIHFTTIAGEELDKIGEAIKANDISALSAYFESKLELTILEDEGTYSKAQAEQVVKDFLTKHKPTSFKLIHRGSSGGSRFGIGELNTSKGIFRTYVYIKESGGKTIIQELRFLRE